MPDLREQFEDVLEEFSAATGLDVSLVGDAACLTVDEEIIVNIQYMDQSDTVLLWSPVGGFGGTDAPDAGAKALALLRLGDLGGPSAGFTLALDADADVVLALDRRSARVVSSADALAGWIEALVRAVRAVREHFAVNFPAGED